MPLNLNDTNLDRVSTQSRLGTQSTGTGAPLEYVVLLFHILLAVTRVIPFRLTLRKSV